MTTQSHTELAALAKAEARWMQCSDDPEFRRAADVLARCAAALESPERVQGEANIMRPEVLIDGNAESAHIRETLTPSARSRSTTTPTAPAQDAQGDELLRDLEALMNNNRITVSESTLVWRAMQRIAAAATPSPQEVPAGAHVWEVTNDAFSGLYATREAAEAFVSGTSPSMGLQVYRRDVIGAALRASTPAERVPLSEAQCEDVMDEARKLHRRFTSGVRGQQLTVSDSADYWVIRATEQAHGIVTKESST